jgi:hypothetical protein
MKAQITVQHIIYKDLWEKKYANMKIDILQ